jgi:glycosyltransferase involved in cell wall biosynthesis
MDLSTEAGMQGDRGSLIEAIRRDGLFDDGFYFGEITGPAGLPIPDELTLLEHFIEIGASRGLRGHPDDAVARRLRERWGATRGDPHPSSRHDPVLFVISDLEAEAAASFLLPFLAWLRASPGTPGFEALVTTPRRAFFQRGAKAVALADTLAAMTTVHWLDEHSGAPGNMAQIEAGHYAFVFVNSLVSVREDYVVKLLQGAGLVYAHELDVALEESLGPDGLQGILAVDACFVASSQAAAAALERHGVRPDRVVVSHPFIATARASDDYAHRRLVREQLATPREAVIVLIVGDVVWSKGAYLLSGVARSLKDKSPASEWPYFVWVGDSGDGGVARRLAREFALLGMEEHLRLVGRDDDVARFYAAADIFLVASVEDSFPLAMLEAAAAGLPLVAFEMPGGASEFIAADHGGLAVPALDTSAMAAALILLARNLKLRIALGEQARVSARHFSLDVAAPKLRDLILKLRDARETETLRDDNQP